MGCTLPLPLPTHNCWICSTISVKWSLGKNCCFMIDVIVCERGWVCLKLDVQGQGSARTLVIAGQGGGRSWKLVNFLGRHTCIVPNLSEGNWYEDLHSISKPSQIFLEGNLIVKCKAFSFRDIPCDFFSNR